MYLSIHAIENWANAITKIAIKENKVNNILDQCHALAQSLKNKEDFINILTIKKNHNEEQRIKIIEETFGPFDFDESLMNVMKILVEIQAFVSARTIFKHVRKNLSKFKHNIHGVVWSTEYLSQDIMRDLEIKISHKIKDNIKLVNKIDLSLIAGVTIIVNDKIFDGSVKGKLEKIKNKALKFNHEG